MDSRLVATAALAFFSSLWVTACSVVPSSGPTVRQIVSVTGPASGGTELHNPMGIQIVDVTDAVARQLISERKHDDFASILGTQRLATQRFGPGDAIEISIWESPPATLFSAGAPDSDVGSGARATVLPVQVIDAEGTVTIPFAGQVRAAGRTSNELAKEIIQRLKGKANQPQVIVRLVKNATSYVTVVGDVTNSSRMELTAGHERLLDALASAGGVRQAVDKTTIQLTRGSTVAALPLQNIIRDPRQNVPLAAGDVVTALYQPMSFTVLGATGKNDEINFETQGISLAQALARSGGLNDARSDPKGVFIFRFEPSSALNWPGAPVRTTPDDMVPVVYRIDLKDPASFFVAQSFPIDNKDILYISNAPTAELQKFLNLVFSIAYPITNVIRAYD